MPDRVDALVLAPQAPVGDPTRHAIAVDARGEQLRVRNPAVLARGDPRDSGS